MSPPKVVIFNDTHGWHSEQLVNALQSLGITAVLTDLAECTIDLDHPTGLIIPGFEDQLPAAAMVRGIAPGSLEQITLRMDVLHTLAELNVPVFNPASAIEHTVDKARTSLRLHLARLNTPKTWACENSILARKIAAQQFYKDIALVIKPLFGCQGKGIEKITNLDQFDAIKPVGNTFYMQEYIAPFEQELWQDWRLMVIDSQVCAAMSRRSQHWITNFAQGADCFTTTVTSEMEQLAIDATRAVQADYAGVDLIRNQDGSYTILEVNSVPAWKGLYQATGINIAQHLAQALATRIQTSVNTTLGHAKY
ncbi:MAG: RimK family alpha-L-glutamate ligase [Gammaproteobacteria bacterium]|nr:MAG: RimK family alpha-L-glutamate ligase [Gammaproteobacteria bacterium]RKZ95585.1 MAG: RimK family alpha-L-glutamate ligase [Gammaproteobacteria bacterium]RKZ98448.1 MAG: RimK family alpha-L-glutamate ligase [Gammaproteobacteria bacterium]RLA01974.1 MAG: RimK family alpha-L-glutamate ligase [Gammaproteobacteria bacterium]